MVLMYEEPKNLKELKWQLVSEKRHYEEELKNCLGDMERLPYKRALAKVNEQLSKVNEQLKENMNMGGLPYELMIEDKIEQVKFGISYDNEIMSCDVSIDVTHGNKPCGNEYLKVKFKYDSVYYNPVQMLIKRYAMNKFENIAVYEYSVSKQAFASLLAVLSDTESGMAKNLLRELMLDKQPVTNSGNLKHCFNELLKGSVFVREWKDGEQ